MNNTYQNIFNTRHPNGGISFFSIYFKDQTNFLNYQSFSKSESEILKKLVQTSEFNSRLISLNIDLGRINFDSRRFQFRPHSFNLLSELSYRIFKGGQYFEQVKGLQEINTETSISITLSMLSSVLGNDFGKYSSLYIEEVAWNSWFYVDYLSDSFLIFDNEKSLLHVILIRDTD